MQIIYAAKKLNFFSTLILLPARKGASKEHMTKARDNICIFEHKGKVIRKVFVDILTRHLVRICLSQYPRNARPPIDGSEIILRGSILKELLPQLLLCLLHLSQPQRSDAGKHP
jgi:hypothetical protein